MKTLYFKVVVADVSQDEWGEILESEVWENNSDNYDTAGRIGYFAGFDDVTNNSDPNLAAAEIAINVRETVGRFVPITVEDGNGKQYDFTTPAN